MPVTPSNVVVPLVFLGLIVWRVYRRIRRSIGRQPVRRKRLTTGIILYSVISVVLAVTAHRLSQRAGGPGRGIAGGGSAGADRPAFDQL